MISRKTPVILAALALLLFYALFAVNRFEGRNASQESIPSELLPEGTADTLSIRIEKDGVTTEIERPDGVWRFADGKGVGRVDTTATRELLDTLRAAPIRSAITGLQRERRSLSIADFGLEPARATVSFRLPDRTLVLAFGTSTPAGDGLFVRIGDADTIYVVDKALYDLLPAAPEFLRDRRLFTARDRDITAFEIRRPERQPVRFERKDGYWRQTAPFECATAEAAFDKLLYAIRTATIERFVASGAAAEEERIRLGLTSEEAHISLSVWLLGENAPHDFLFGAPSNAEGEQTYATSFTDRFVGIVDRSLVDALSLPSERFRDHRVIPLDETRLLAASFRLPELEVELRRTSLDAPWRFVRPSDQPADPAAVTAFLKTLCSLTDTNVLFAAHGPDANTLGPDGIRVHLEPEGQGHAMTLDIAPGRALSDGLLYAFPESDLPALTPALFAGLRSRLVLEAPEGTTLPPPLADLIAARVESLSTGDASALGFAPPRNERMILSSIPDRPVILLQLGRKRPDGLHYFRIKGDDPVFAIDEDTLARLFPDAAPAPAPAP